jgi:acyl carrier protein
MDEQLRTLIADVLGIDAQEVHPGMQRSQTGTWDSLGHLRLITALERHFGVALRMEEIERIHTPAELQEAIERHRGAGGV